MMRLSTMLRVDGATSAEGRNPVAEAALEHWRHDAGSLRFFRSSANFVHVFRVDGALRFLRLAEGSERRREAIEDELALLRVLAVRGLPVAIPCESDRGRSVEMLATPLGVFHACAFAALQGEQWDEDDELSADRLLTWGEALGRLHAEARELSRDFAPSRETHEGRLSFIRSHLGGDERARRELESLSAALARLPIGKRNYGLVHGDFELDNLFWNGSLSGIADFDDAFHCWYLADVAFALASVYPSPWEQPTSLETFLAGYTQHSELDEDVYALLPVFWRLASLQRYARLVRSLDLPADQEYPDWMESLHAKLVAWVTRYLSSLQREP
jgi:Ser/Thr protein kinase RdoA (MazF antagonist)